MALTYTYPDAYLSKYCTEAREARAIAYVATLGTFAAAWTERLVICRCYVLACLENQGDAEDLFAAKLKNYTKEFDTLLSGARAATVDADGNVLPVFSVPLERA